MRKKKYCGFTEWRWLCLRCAIQNRRDRKGATLLKIALLELHIVVTWSVFCWGYRFISGDSLILTAVCGGWTLLPRFVDFGSGSTPLDRRHVSTEKNTFVKRYLFAFCSRICIAILVSLFEDSFCFMTTDHTVLYILDGISRQCNFNEHQIYCTVLGKKPYEWKPNGR